MDEFGVRSKGSLPPCPVSNDELIDGLLGALRWFEKAYAIICRRAEMEFITSKEYVVLRMIVRYAKRRRAPQIRELAEALDFDKSYITKLSRWLIKERLVQRVPPRRDRRNRALDLTKSGEEVARTDYLGELLWELLVAEFGSEKANELAWALPHLARQPNFGRYCWPVDDD